MEELLASCIELERITAETLKLEQRVVIERAVTKSTEENS